MKHTFDLKKTKQAAQELSIASEKQINLFLRHLSAVLLLNQSQIVKANKRDLAKAKDRGLSHFFIERLSLDKAGIKQLIMKLKAVKRLHSGVGEVIEERVSKNNLLLRKVRTPLGVIAVIYEARPEVTIEVAALCIKSHNAAILKGGSEAIGTNKAIYKCILTALRKTGLSKEAIGFIANSDRSLTNWLLQQHDYISLVIAGGGYDLVKTVLKQSTIPVLAHAAGGARIYVDKSANLSMAEKIIINAKTSKPAVCNSLDTVVIHKDIAAEFKPRIVSKLKKSGVKIVENIWDTEFLDLALSIKIVANMNEAIEFINLYSKGHSEGIIAADKKVIDCFTKSIDTAAIFINCSTRLHDGYIFGLGAEMGISTSKLHARGPVGLKELTSYKWEVHGNGQIRE